MFESLTRGYLRQSLLMMGCSLYQLAAIYCCKDLLVYRNYVSRVNKISLLIGLYMLFYTILYRMSEEGAICSGDYLSEA